MQERKKGLGGQLFMKLFVNDDPSGGASESQEVVVLDGALEENPGKLRSRIELLNAKIEAMGRVIEDARMQSTADQAEIAELKTALLSYYQLLEEHKIRLQRAIDENNTTAAQNRKLQNEYKTAKLNLEREKSANSRARVVFDTSLSSRELAAQLHLLAEAGTPAPDFFLKLFDVRNKALGEANIRAQKAETARATAEASAREETRKMKVQIENMKAQMEEYQAQQQTLRHQLQQQQQQQQQHPPCNGTAAATNDFNRKRQAPLAWLGDTETTQERAGVRPIVQPRKHQIISGRNIGIGGLATKANPRAALELEEVVKGLIGPSSELPSMHTTSSTSAHGINFMMPPPPPKQQQKKKKESVSIQDPPPPELAEEEVVEEPPAAGAGAELNIHNNDDDDAPGPSVAAAAAAAAAAGDKANSKLLEFRRRLLERKQAHAGGRPVQLAAAAPPPPAPPAAALVDNNNDSNSNPGPIEWGTEGENAAANLDEEEDVIELISDSEGEDVELDFEIETDDDAAAAPAPVPTAGIENHPPTQLNNTNNNQHHQRPPPSKPTISLLAAGPSKIALHSAPGTSFIRNPQFATTGLKDDGKYINCGPDGKGGRAVAYKNGKQQNNNTRVPAWGGGVITDHVKSAGGGGGGAGNGNHKRAKGGAGAGASKPINQYFSKPSPSLSLSLSRFL
jgi:hypothetical protein